MPTPINNGKVQIGILYQPPMPVPDPDMSRLMAALCPPDKQLRESINWSAIIGDIGALVVMVATVVGVFALPPLLYCALK